MSGEMRAVDRHFKGQYMLKLLKSIDSTLGYEPGGRWFESIRVRQLSSAISATCDDQKARTVRPYSAFKGQFKGQNRLTASVVGLFAFRHIDLHRSLWGLLDRKRFGAGD